MPLVTRDVYQVLAEFRQILFEMKWLLPWGSITNYHPTGGHEVPHSHPPVGLRSDGTTEEQLHVQWQRRWNRALSTHAREIVLEEARAEVEQWHKRPVQAPVGDESTLDLEARMVREGRGWDAKQVAQHFNCTPTFVRRVRLSAGVNPANGEPSLAIPAGTADESERARQLVREGLSERQIRMLMKCGGSKLQRLLKEGDSNCA